MDGYRSNRIARLVWVGHRCDMDLPPTDEDRIRELCAMAISARSDEWEPILAELRAALREHVTFLREMARTMNGVESDNNMSPSNAAN